MMMSTEQSTPQNTPVKQTLTKQAQEIVLILPSYIAQLAESQDRNWSFEFLPDAQCAERILFAWLRINVVRMAWEVLLDHPDIAEIHPAVTLVRSDLGPVVDILIAEDLRPWLPKNHGNPCAFPTESAGIAVDLGRGGDALDLGIPA